MDQKLKDIPQSLVVLDESLPTHFTVRFLELVGGEYPQVQVIRSESHLGDIIDDNCYEDDGYRYHDIFHYTFATLLDWSPCARSMMKRKRKSAPELDRIEDGARATITEEAISLMLFNEAKDNEYFEYTEKIDDRILDIIVGMTRGFEGCKITKLEWEKAILKAYEIFRQLIRNRGGIVTFDAIEKMVQYAAP